MPRESEMAKCLVAFKINIDDSINKRIETESSSELGLQDYPTNSNTSRFRFDRGLMHDRRIASVGGIIPRAQSSVKQGLRGVSVYSQLWSSNEETDGPHWGSICPAWNCG